MNYTLPTFSWLDAKTLAAVDAHNAMVAKFNKLASDFETSRKEFLEADDPLAIDPSSVLKFREAQYKRAFAWLSLEADCIRNMQALGVDIITWAGVARDEAGDRLAAVEESTLAKFAELGITPETRPAYHANPAAAKTQVLAMVRQSDAWVACNAELTEIIEQQSTLQRRLGELRGALDMLEGQARDLIAGALRIDDGFAKRKK